MSATPPTKTGKDVRVERAAKRVAQNRIKRTARKEAGLCADCGKNPPRPGVLTCQTCAAQQTANYQKRLQARAGLCVWCGTEPSRPNRRLCRACADKVSDHGKHRRARLTAAGLCIHCGKTPFRPGSTMCQPCHTRNNQAARRAKARMS